MSQTRQLTLQKILQRRQRLLTAQTHQTAQIHLTAQTALTAQILQSISTAKIEASGGLCRRRT
jgi:hypothetical protein